MWYEYVEIEAIGTTYLLVGTSTLYVRWYVHLYVVLVGGDPAAVPSYMYGCNIDGGT